MANLLPTNDPDWEGLLLVVLKSYFDGGNKADSTRYEILSLAAVSGTVDEWSPFERDWKEVLQKHKAKFLHTTDAWAFQGIYEGWKAAQRDRFLLDCVRVAGKHGARATIGNEIGRYGLLPFVVSVNLKDFIACAKVNPRASKNADEACLRQALAEVITWSEQQAACDECHCFFDQGEPFYGHLVQMLQSKKARIDAPYLNKITFRGEADSVRTPALQLADLYAWCQGHRNMPNVPKWQRKLLSTHFRWQWIDHTNVNDINLPHQETFQTWNLPKRAATK